MRRLLTAVAALGLVWTAQTTTADAAPHARSSGVIVYVSDQDSTSADDVIDEIYAVDPQTRDITRLTYDLPGVERWPVVSPDGRSLAWIRWEVDANGVPRQDLSTIYRCKLRYRAGTLTCRQPRRVIGPVSENVIAWTADSRGLIYSGAPNADFDNDLYKVDVRTGRTQNLTNDAVLDGTFVANAQPAVSPDGRHIVYVRVDPGRTGPDLYRRDIDGSNPVQLTAALGSDNAPEYSPDGKRIVFHSGRDGDADVYVMRATVEGPDNPAVNLTDELRSADGRRPSQERSASFSPDGRHISFWWFTRPASGYAAGFDDGDIYTMRDDGTHVRNLTDNNPTDPAALTVGDIQPDWGPSPSRRHHR